ncbi:hypothetical protein ACWEN3_39030 [Streptomyces sp. NPDC004561]
MPQPNPTPPMTGTMPQPNPTPPTTGTTPPPGPPSGPGNGGQGDHGQGNGFGFGEVRPGHGFGDQNHIHHFRLNRHHLFCFFVHRHVVIRIIRLNDHRVVIVKTIVPGHLVCLNPFREF